MTKTYALPQTPGSFDFKKFRYALGENLGYFDVNALAECTSTNTLLRAAIAEGAPTGTVIVTDKQTEGRGRRGRTWQASPEHSLTFSVLWRFNHHSSLTALSLVVGLAIAFALEKLGVQGITLKWPNDIYLFNRKLAGVLIETNTTTEGIAAVIGIGLNLRTAPEWAEHIDQAYSSLEQHGFSLSREQVLAAVLHELIQVLEPLPTEGFASWQAAWQKRHAYQDLPVRILADQQESVGLCRGVNDKGALLLETTEGIITVWAGDVSLRGA